jgi:CHAT domain-containing protein/Tfp pilus assembly protein PilF
MRETGGKAMEIGRIAFNAKEKYNRHFGHRIPRVKGRFRVNLSVLVLIWTLLARAGAPSSDLRAGQAQFWQASVQASVLRSQGEYEKAVVSLREALSISEQFDLQHHHRLGLVRMGLLLWDLARIPESWRCFSEAMTAFEHAGDLQGAHFCRDCAELIRLYERGKKDRETKLYYVSLQRFDKAIALGRATGIPDFELKCLRQKCLTFWEMDRTDSFKEMSEQGLLISMAIHHEVERGRCLNNIGIAYHKQNEFSLAVEYLENALSCIRKTGDTPTEAECLSNLGILYRDLGNSQRALHYLEGALAIDQEIGDRTSVSADLGNIGTVLLREGVETRNEQSLFRGLEAFRKSLNLSVSGLADTYSGLTALNNIGIILNELGEHRESRAYFEKALKAASGEAFALERGHLLSNIAASFLYENRIDEARRYYEMSYELGVVKTLENVVIESSFGLGKCYELDRSYSAALEFYLHSLSALENVRGRVSSEILTIGFERNKLGVYQSIIDILTLEYEDRPSQELLGRIFDIVERAKARAFLENIRYANMDKAVGESPLIRERQQALSKNIRELNERLSRPDLHEEEKADIDAELEHEEDEFVRLSFEAKADRQGVRNRALEGVCSIEDIQRQVLDDETILLEYDLGEKRSSLLLVTTASAELFTIPGRAELERSLRAFLKLTAERSIDSKDCYRASERIAQEILPFTARDDFRGAKKLIVIPDEILHYLPFETLRVVSPAGSRFLIEKLALSYCPSASSLWALKNIRNIRPRGKDLLAVGEPLYTKRSGRPAETALKEKAAGHPFYGDKDIDFPSLPFSREEVREIAKMFPEEKVKVLVGQAASEDAVKALPLEEFRIIHLACHGLLDESHPFRSALVLSLMGERENDGFLQMREIYGLTTRADLVVLSACQTARGLLEHAEGPMGLARPFFFTGARSVVASLWTVNDKAAVLFMREFYRQFLTGKTAGDALRLAKIKFLKSARDQPFYWASFVLIGDSEVTALKR